MLMDEYDRLRILKNTDSIADNVIVDDIIPYLLSDLLITFNDM